MNDLQGDVLLFADDVKVTFARANFDDLQHAWDWASAWDLPLNENKCGHISIGSAPTCPLTLSDNGISIKLLDSTKTLASLLIVLSNHLCTVLKPLKELVLPCS